MRVSVWRVRVRKFIAKVEGCSLTWPRETDTRGRGVTDQRVRNCDPTVTLQCFLSIQAATPKCPYSFGAVCPSVYVGGKTMGRCLSGVRGASIVARLTWPMCGHSQQAANTAVRVHRPLPEAGEIQPTFQRKMSSVEKIRGISRF